MECDTSSSHGVRSGQLIKSWPWSSKVGWWIPKGSGLQALLPFEVSRGTHPQHVCVLRVTMGFSCCLSAEKTFHCTSC